MRRKVPLLGIVYILLGLWGLFLAAVVLVLQLFGLTAQIADQVGDAGAVGAMFQGAGMFVAVGWSAFISLLTLMSGAQIRKFRGRGLALLVAIMHAIPCCGADFCCTWIFSVPIGIWALVVLLNKDTKAAFAKVADGYLPEEVLGG